MLQPSGPLAAVVAILIHLVVPGAGLAAYGRIVRRMQAEAVPHAPVASLFVIFACYGGWLLVLLTSLAWYWSGMASLGVGFLVVLAPFIMVALAFRLGREAHLSRYHRAAFHAAAAYVPVVVFVVGATLVLTG